jgi:hypothetical protein
MITAAMVHSNDYVVIESSGNVVRIMVMVYTEPKCGLIFSLSWLRRYFLSFFKSFTW